MRLPVSSRRDPIPTWLVACAIAVLFLIANFPPSRIMSILGRTAVSPEWLQMVKDLKALFFLLGLIVLAIPLAGAFRDGWRTLGKARSLACLKVSVLLFFALAALTVPYCPTDASQGVCKSGFVGHGFSFAAMSYRTFGMEDEAFFRRILMPGLASLLQLKGILYYPFSLFVTWALTFVSVVFFEQRLGPPVGRRNTAFRWLGYLSVLTSTYVFTSFQFPGFPEPLGFVFLILLAILPLTFQGRLACLTLCLLGHDGMAFVLAPLVLFGFPRKERIPALFVLGSFYAIGALSYGFDFMTALKSHEVLGDKSQFAYWQNEPGVPLAGMFFAFKLLWVALLWHVLKLFRSGDRRSALGAAACTLAAVPILFIAWDTTRLMGFGFFGILLASGELLRKLQDGSVWARRAAIGILAANLLIPTHHIALARWESHQLTYFWPGVYRLISSVP